jgi:hypothetical protein
MTRKKSKGKDRSKRRSPSGMTNREDKQRRQTKKTNKEDKQRRVKAKA